MKIIKNKNLSTLVQENKIGSYQKDIFERLVSTINLSDKTVLEVGGSNFPKDLTHDFLNVKKWVCVDLIEGYQIAQNKEHYNSTILTSFDDPNLEKKIKENDYIIIQGNICDINKKLYNFFDCCISSCSFEHIDPLDKAIDKIYSALKNNAILYSNFGPIFSCKYGAHYWYNTESNFNKQEECLDYIHLLLDNDELYKYLHDHFDAVKANVLFDHFVVSPRINRLFYDDYVTIMNNSLFKHISIEALYRIEVEPAILEKIYKRYPGNSNFDVYSIELIAKKLQ